MRKLSVMLVLLSVQGYLLAGISLPEWVSGDGTVHAEWSSWNSSKSALIPDAWSAANPAGLVLSDSPDAMMYEYGCYVTQIGDRSDAIALRGFGYSSMDYFIPNYGLDADTLVRFEITYQALGYKPILGIEAYDDGVQLVNSVMGSYLKEFQNHNDGWITEVHEFMVTAACDYEFITLGFNYSGNTGIGIDRVVIDTVCIPEPATIGILALGFMALFRKK